MAIPPTHAKSALPGLEIYVDLAGFIDVKAELAKNEQQEQKLLGLIKGKEAKLTNESFVSRAPANVVQSERESLAQLQEQLESVSHRSHRAASIAISLTRKIADPMAAEPSDASNTALLDISSAICTTGFSSRVSARASCSIAVFANSIASTTVTHSPRTQASTNDTRSTAPITPTAIAIGK